MPGGVSTVDNRKRRVCNMFAALLLLVSTYVMYLICLIKQYTYVVSLVAQEVRMTLLS